MFLMASITKPITFMGAMLLIEQGQLNLNDGSRYIPEFAETAKKKRWSSTLHAYFGIAGRAAQQRRVAARSRTTKRFIQRRFRPNRFQARNAAQLLDCGNDGGGEIVQRLTGVSPFKTTRGRESSSRWKRSRPDLGAKGLPVSDWCPGPRLPSRIERELEQHILAGAWPPGGGLFTTAEDLRRHLSTDARRRQGEQRAAVFRPRTSG